MDEEIKFVADKVTISGPKPDGSFVISFEVGEYERDKVLEIMKLPPNLQVKVSQNPL